MGSAGLGASVTAPALAALALNGAVWLYLKLRLSAMLEVLPIHYNSAGQVDRIGVRDQLFILPVIGLLTLGTNIVLAVLLIRRDPQLSYILLAVAVLVQLLLLGAAVQLVH